MARSVTEAEIRKAAKQAGLPYNVLYALIYSGERSGANSVSPRGARGQAQLMPGTARALQQRYRINTSTPYGNLLGGAYYLAEQKKRFGSWRKAFAAYNAGPGAVTEYGGVPPFEETRNYVKRVMDAIGGTSTSDPSLTTSTGGSPGVPSSPAAPGLTEEAVHLQGLQSLAQGRYDPVEQLRGLQEVAESTPATAGPQTGSESVSEAPAPVQVSGPGITYAGQKLTHDTDGLPGYPAIDLFADPGTPFVAPEDGKVVRRSGRGGTSGQVYGYSIYFQGKSGRKYFITHLGRDRARLGRYKAGSVLGTVSPWDGGAPHAHVGIKEPRRKR